ncbi:MAG TPA: response regulator transcription factor [Bacteroidales bacterium]|nr:response regulator transcription factor [Bacteroidales bacterium]
MKSIKKILIVDDHKIFREAIAFLTSQIDGYEVVAEASDGLTFLDILSKTEVDLVLLDLSMPGIDGIESASIALKKNPELKIIILTMDCSLEDYNFLVETGVSGFLLKETGKKEFIKALNEVSSGNKYYSQKLLQKMILTEKEEIKATRSVANFSLTPTENQILRLLCQGHSMVNISEKLSISIKMVETYKAELMAKTKTRNSINLAVFALKNQLVTI